MSSRTQLAACNAAAQIRDHKPVLDVEPDPGSAEHRFALHRARDDRVKRDELSSNRQRHQLVDRALHVVGIVFQMLRAIRVQEGVQPSDMVV